jgi:hypothetical protein
MANAQKPTQRTQHMDIKYFALCNWVEQDLLILDQIDTKINLANPFTKALERATFHRHVEFIIGRVPPWYSPIYSKSIGAYTDDLTDNANHVLESFMTLLCAAAARIYAPLPKDYLGNPWVHILWHGQYNTVLRTGLWGGDIV